MEADGELGGLDAGCGVVLGLATGYLSVEFCLSFRVLRGGVEVGGRVGVGGAVAGVVNRVVGRVVRFELAAVSAEVGVLLFGGCHRFVVVRVIRLAVFLDDGGEVCLIARLFQVYALEGFGGLRKRAGMP